MHLPRLTVRTSIHLICSNGQTVIQPSCGKLFHTSCNGRTLIQPSCGKLFHTSCNGQRLLQKSHAQNSYSKMEFHQLIHQERTRSSLFISNAIGQHTAVTQVDLDLDWRLQQGLESLQESLRKRHITIHLQSIIEDYRLFTELNSRKNTLEEERDAVSAAMKHIVKSKMNTPDIVKSKEVLTSRGREIKENLRRLMPKWWALEERLILSTLNLPNDLHPDTLDSEQTVIKELNLEATKEVRKHLDLGKASKMIKFSNVGPTAYYLRGELARLEQTLQSYITTALRDKGFIQLSCPEVFRSPVIEGCCEDILDPEKVYTLSSHLQEESQHPKIINSYHLAGVSVTSFAAFLLKSLTPSSSLPLKYFTLGRHYTPQDMNYSHGLYGVSQSIQGHFFVGCSTMDECDKIKSDMEEFLSSLFSHLQLPVRIVRVAACELKLRERYRCEVQIYSPVYDMYIQAGYVSVIGDYISRRLNIHITSSDQKQQYLYMIEGCVLNITKTLAAFLENNYNEASNSFEMSEELKKYQNT